MRIKAETKALPQTKTKVVLAGNPNAGKTTLFNALTKSNLRTGNFHGVTTSSAQKEYGNFIFWDCPGLYAMKAFTMEEVSAQEQINSADIIINVIDALTLENGLNLTRKLISSGKYVIVYVTKLNLLKKRGGKIDLNGLSSLLGAPVLSCKPKELLNFLNHPQTAVQKSKNARLEDVYFRGREGLSIADKLFYNRFFALAFFIVSVTAMFFFAFYPKMPGALLKDLTENLISVKLCAFLMGGMQNEAVISLVAEGILGGAGSVLSFIPQLAVLYLFLTLLDESGITSSLSFTTDGLFEKVNLSGRAAFSLISGFGCTAAAILTTRGYASKSAQRRTVAILPFIPCGAKMPVFLTLLSPLFENPFPVITIFYFSGLFISVLLSKLLKGGNETLLSEVTPIEFPEVKAVFKKLYFYLKGFIIKVCVTVMLFCIISWVLSHFSFAFKYVTPDKSMLAGISRLIKFIFVPMGVSDWRIAYAVLCGLIAKENVAATIAMLMPAGTSLALAPSLAVCTFILLCPACVSALSASVKEVGLKFTLKCVAFQTVIAFLGAYLINFLFSL